MSRPDRKAMLDRDRRGLSIRGSACCCRWRAPGSTGGNGLRTTTTWY
jgi:hypothetical protein